jgi:hypothetical protein
MLSAIDFVSANEMLAITATTLRGPETFGIGSPSNPEFWITGWRSR